MAQYSLPNLATFIALFFLCFLILSPPEMVEGKLCERPSQTWSGKCGNTQHCDHQCQSWESAKHGACHSRGGWKCFCYFDCASLKTGDPSWSANVSATTTNSTADDQNENVEKTKN